MYLGAKSSKVVVKRCFMCHGDTEYHCASCRQDLCRHCKETHVTVLETKKHNVMIYRQKFNVSLKEEVCLIHGDKLYDKYCKNCDVPICDSCYQDSHNKHEILHLKRAYLEKWQKTKPFIDHLRRDILCQKQISLQKKHISCSKLSQTINQCAFDMQVKGQRLKDMMKRMLSNANPKNKYLTIKILLAKYIVRKQNDEYRHEQSANRPVEFLRFIKGSKKARSQDMIKKEPQLKLMPSPVLKESFGSAYYEILCVSQSRIWFSNMESINVLDTSSNQFFCNTQFINRMGGRIRDPGVTTVNNNFELIYINGDNNIIKLSRDLKTFVTLKKKTSLTVPQSVYCSRLTGDLLVGMGIPFASRKYIHRYTSTGKLMKIIHCGNKSLYLDITCITENNNGDIVVSDCHGGAVVVTDSTGRYRFSYTCRSSNSALVPLGICTDALSHILVCNAVLDCVHMIDKDGQFLSRILTKQTHGLIDPWGLSYDINSSSMGQPCQHSLCL